MSNIKWQYSFKFPGQSSNRLGPGYVSIVISRMTREDAVDREIETVCGKQKETTGPKEGMNSEGEKRKG